MIQRTISLLAIVLLAACAAGSKSYYVLTADGPAPSGGGIGIGVGPISLAEYIDRPNLVIAESPNQLSIAEDHRWAGDLSASIARVTAANLGRLMHTGNVRTYPWRTDDGINYQITLDIRQLHSGADGYAVIEAGWRAYSLPDRKIKASKTFVDREPLASDGYDALVAAQSRLLSRLAQNIAAGLK
ncbi:MAG: membrane integrity-associated transporter subunit PqiC [Gloeobacteraceae cyanobacterium ES-bin-144]|nr:membrane integrity-associated transporter subunit PqiC [Verrucomicrobiales bacterium]